MLIPPNGSKTMQSIFVKFMHLFDAPSLSKSYSDTKELAFHVGRDTEARQGHHRTRTLRLAYLFHQRRNPKRPISSERSAFLKRLLKVLADTHRFANGFHLGAQEYHSPLGIFRRRKRGIFVTT